MKTAQNNKNIALVELGGSHTECMHLQIKALKESGYKVFLICNSILFDDFPDKTVFNAYQLHKIDHSLKSLINDER
jgi:predicted CoA-binding protein